jgi:hypothetical protein
VAASRQVHALLKQRAKPRAEPGATKLLQRLRPIKSGAEQAEGS